VLRRILDTSLQFRVLVLAVAAVVTAAGLVFVQRAPVDALPEFGPPRVRVQAEALGLSAAEVEQLITVPLEQDLLNGVPWLDTIRSESVPGRSSIDLVFEPGTDVLHARQMVQEHLTQAHALPAVGTPPVMMQPLSSTSRVMMLGLTAKDLSPIDLSILARWKLKPLLMGIRGVANVSIWGERDRQLQVQIHPDRLRAHGVSLDQVINTTGNALWVSPLTFVEASTPGTGGFIDTATQRFAIQHVLPITTAKGLAAVSVEDTGDRRLRLGQVANVVEDHQPLIGDAVLGDGTGLMMVVDKFPEANTLEVTHKVEAALAALRPGLAGVRIDAGVYRPASFLSAALGDLGRAGLLALVLVVVLLGAVTRSWRVAVVGAATMGLSLLLAAYVLYLRGTTFNLMVLAGLAVALGVLIDDAVVSVDAVRRRVREAHAAGEAGPVAGTVTAALAEVRRPLLSGTVVALLAPLPALALTGVAGSFARPLLVSYALAVAASTVVALTVAPALAVLLPGRGRASAPASPGRLGGAVAGLAAAFAHRTRWVYATVAVLVLLTGAGAVAQLGRGAPLPSLADPHVLVHWQAAPGTSLPETARVTARAIRELRAVPGVAAVGAHVGRAVMSDAAVGVASGEVWLRLADTADHDATVAAIERVVRGYPGLRGDVVTYPEDQIRAVRAGPDRDLVVRVYGTDLTVLRTEADEIRGLLSSMEGVVAPTVQTQSVEPTLEVRVDLAAAQRHGIKPGDVRRAAATFFAGLPVGSLYEEQKIFDVVVWGIPTQRYAPANVAELLLDTPRGGHVRLGDVATVRIAPAPTVIRHDNISRSLDVTASVHGRGAGAVRDEVRARLAGLAMPLEYHAEVRGPGPGAGVDRRVAALAVAVAIGLLLVFQAAFGSWRLAGLLLLALPLAAAGGLVAALFLGGGSGAAVLIGLLTVVGLAARHGLLVVHALRRHERETRTEPVVAATREFFAPVVLTALLTAAVLLSLAWWGGAAGAALLGPMAVVVLGGLVTSTVVTVLVVPALYLRLSPVDQGRPT
jgi:Cu/Ag efflux pump CusA